MQETALYDITHYEDARRHGIRPGCKVLAPWQADMERYGPGTVLQGREQRGLHSDHDGSEGLIVNFWNGKTEKVPPGIAIWIPVLLGERIILELQMTITTKQKLLETYPGYPQIVPPGYRGSWNSGDEFEPVYHFSIPCECQGHHSNCSQGLCWIPDNPLRHLGPEVMLPDKSVASRSGLEDKKSPETTLTREELSQKVTKQLSQHDLPFCSNSPIKKKGLKSVEFVMGSKTSLERDIEKLDNLKTLRCKSASLVDLTMNKSTSVGNALNTDCGLFNGLQNTKEVKEKDTWKYWKRIPSAPLQKKPGTLQPTSLITNHFPNVCSSGPVNQRDILNTVDQSLKADHIGRGTTANQSRPGNTDSAQQLFKSKFNGQNQIMKQTERQQKQQGQKMKMGTSR
uniref:uncharacterized protein C11orf16 homolog n=1 Tax=Pristiophorus japonicus TaxID=55135 RepID=UPI00398E37DB